MEEEQRTGIGQGKDSQICAAAGAASSGAEAAKWHEKKFLKTPQRCWCFVGRLSVSPIQCRGIEKGLLPRQGMSGFTYSTYRICSLLLLQTQPIPGVVWAHLADFLLLQEYRTANAD